MKRLLLLSALTAIFLFLAGVPVFAGTTTLTGTLTDAQSLTNDNDDNVNACGTLSGANTWYYTLRQFQVTETGDYTYADIGFNDSDLATIDMWIAFYTGDPSGFDPADPRTNGCFANFDDAGMVSLTAGVSYMIKISTESPGETGDYIFSLTGPGDAIAPPVPEEPEVTPEPPIVTIPVLRNPMLEDGRINGQQAAPVILYCVGTVTHGLDTNGQVLFDVENGESASGMWGSIGPRADGRMMLTAAFPDTKPYYFIYDGCDNGSYVALSGNPAIVFDSGRYPTKPER